ncbi:DNA polymerase IV [bacterium]|nr:DNA polymerase IV [Bacteroidota bacterium]MDA9938375.1 DNA polymerase IV [Salibacteraceae bacterium]MDB9983990.1 DNA polymerase IV [bacterium]
MMKSILHLDLDSFFVSCERLLDSSLNNRPVLIGGTSNRGVVASCSYEARSFGIHSAMPMRMARQLCPEAVIIRGNSSTYSKYSDVVTDIIKDTSPMFEKASIDEFYVDTTGMDRFYGTYVWAKELRERIIKESGLPISFGLSTGKTTAKIGTNEAKPNNHIQVPHGEEKAFMAPLAIRKMPMVGEKTSLKLQQMGVQKIKTVQDMPCELMERVLGKNGISLWKKAQGIDNSPIITYHERKSISIERTFERDTTDVVKLKSIITAMSENLAYQLRNGNKLTGCVTVKIRYSDFTTVTRQLHVPYTSVDHKLINTVQELFKILYARRMLIRLIGVRYSKLVGGGYQINLFEDNEEMVRLYQAMDAMRNKYGQDAVKRAVGMGSKGIGRRNPFNGQPNVIPAHRRA